VDGDRGGWSLTAELAPTLGAWLAPERLSVAALLAARLAPIVWLVPFLGGRILPALTRATLLLALTIALAPTALAGAGSDPRLGPETLSLELLRGLVFGLALALPFHAFEWAGRAIDQWRGAALGEAAMAPTTGDVSSPLGLFHRLFAVAAFVALGGHVAAFRALGRGLARRGVGRLATDLDLGAVAEGSARLVGDALALTVAVAAPAAAALVLTEVFLGLVARAAPQVPVFFAGMPLRAAVGVAAVALALSLTIGAFREAVAQALAVIGAGGSGTPGGPP